MKSAVHPAPECIAATDYTRSQVTIADRLPAFISGCAVGFLVLFIFYRIAAISVAGGVLAGAGNVLAASQSAVRRRISRLRLQFFNLLEAISVAMRAGNPLIVAIQSAREDLLLVYPAGSDIITEVNIIIGRFNNAVPMSAAFLDLAQRSGLEDIASFASIYSAIEGKSGRTDEIVRDIQQIIADKMEIEMEIETLLTAAKSEVNIMLLMPLVILGVIGYAGAGFMDAIYTTAAGRAVSTGGLAMLVACYIMARRFSRVKL